MGSTTHRFLLPAVDAETQSQINDLVELRDAHRRRKKHLELHAATIGMSTSPELAIEIEDIESRIEDVEKSILRLRYQEAKMIASIVPNNKTENITDVALHDRVSAIGNYVLNVESAVHKEMAALLRILDDNTVYDAKQRVSRQRKTDFINYSIIILLFLALIVLLLK